MLKCWCLVLVSSALALTACTKQSATYCATHADDSRCAPPDGAGPACTGDPDCAGMAGTEVCDTSSRTCVQCVAPGNTAACTGATPVCGDDHACRGCTAHDECPSQACLPDGACAADTDVAYVGPMGADGAPCTQAEPCGTLKDALSTDRPIVKFASGVVKDSNTTVIDGQVVTLVAEPGAVLDRDGDGVILEIRGTTTNVQIYDLEISGATGTGNYGISIPTGAAPSVTLTRVSVATNQGGGISTAGGTLTVAQSTISGNTGGGIATTGGTLTVAQSTISSNTGSGISTAGGTLTVTQSTISGNLGGGIAMTANSVITLTNNFIYRNGDSASSSYGGLSLRPATGSKVEFNTIVDNEANTGSASAGGVFCDSAGFVAANNIIFRNTGGATGNIQTFGICTYGNSFNMPGSSNVDNSLQFAQPNLAPFDYRLTANSPASVRDAAGACTGSDFEGDARPSGAACDLGADEYTP